MRFTIALAIVGLSLQACQTTSGDPAAIFAYSGTGDACYADEVLSAEAMQSFSVECRNGQLLYRDDRHEVVKGSCEASEALPNLVRQRVLSDGRTLLLLLKAGTGAVHTGAIVYIDEDDAKRPLSMIDIASLESFGDVLAQDRIVIVSGGTPATGCGMIKHSKELTLDWRLNRVQRERDQSRSGPLLGVAAQSNGPFDCS